MRRKTGAAAVCLRLDLTKDWDYPKGHQIDQVASRISSHPSVGMVEQHGQRRPAGANRVQGYDDFVHKTHNLVLSVRDVVKFVMKSIRKSGAKFKAADKGSDALLVRGFVTAREQRRDGRQSIRLEAIELLRQLEAGKQRFGLRNTILGIEQRG